MDHELNLILDRYKEMYLTENTETKADEQEEGNQDNTTSYGCLMVYFDSETCKKCEEFCNTNIPEESLSDDGIEDESHVTVLYGFHPDITIEDITNFINQTVKEPIELTLKGVSRFECEDYDVIKVDVDSSDLHDLNDKLREAFDGKVEITFPNYHPHMTLAYVKKGALPHLDGNNMFEGENYVFDEFVYSTPGMEDKYLISKNLDMIDSSDKDDMIVGFVI